ncbi:hypothetical protein HF324_00320 [Chitinophaga oryzae]|uniref:Uncharacterized protein n=1 Tax=Chitinophaga oryzae TaxID=2725414 RepID=A0AAE7D6A2_9BACT|nr:hypothetical protein [Chitinophaga oryzae]QJB29836.1 hypothetical protein HF329_00320 [Chitinophaga oryzae]QJB36391.1 hypothetical protein HF324_00320 [Chitinophaga oryzae]
MRIKALLLLLWFIAPQVVGLLHHHHYRQVNDSGITNATGKVYATVKACHICELVNHHGHEPFLLPGQLPVLLNTIHFVHFECLSTPLYTTYALAYTNKGPPSLAATFV